MGRENEAARARRLLALIPYLAEQTTRSLTELAAVTGSDPSTVAADLSLLSLCGGDTTDPLSMIAVSVEDGQAVVFGSMPALERAVRLTADEALALATALETLGVDPGGRLAARLSVHATRDEDLEALARTVRVGLSSDGHAAIVAGLTAAAAAGRAVEIGYPASSGDGIAARVVHPYALFVWRGAWYLHAWCERAGEERTFRVDRVTGLRMTTATFRRPDGLPDEMTALPDLEAAPRAEVRFAGDAPDLTERDWPGATFTRRSDGSVLASIPYVGTRWLARRVAARLGDAEVLAPPEMRAAVAETARHLLDP